MLWVPVDEISGSSRNLPTFGSDLRLLIDILHSQEEMISNNPYHRRDQLKECMHKVTLKDICLLIRDLPHRSRRGKLNDRDIRALNPARTYLLDEWGVFLGTTREETRLELEWILNEIPARLSIIQPHGPPAHSD